jgi:hypothetical protein
MNRNDAGPRRAILADFPRRPETFWDWLLVVLPLQFIHPFLWRIIELRLWAAPNRTGLLLVLFIQSIGGALVFAFLLHFAFYRFMGMSKATLQNSENSGKIRGQ